MTFQSVTSKAIDDELALLASLLTCSDLPCRVAQVYESSGASEQELVARIRHHGLSGLLATRCFDQAEQPLAGLENDKRLLAATEAQRKQELETLFRALKTAGIDNYLLFKGGALAYSMYPYAWQRPRTDTDIFIAQQQLDRVAEVLQTLEYEPLLAVDGQLISYQQSFAKRLPGNSSIMIDVHWKISNRQCLRNSLLLDEMLDNAGYLTEFTARPLIPNIVDSLLIACLHRLGHHHDQERLTWLYDMHLLSQSMTDNHWRQFVEKCIEKKVSALCFSGLELTKQLFATPIPEEKLIELENAAKRAEPSQFLLSAHLSAWALFKSDLAALGSVREKIQYIYETAFPSAHYLREKMGTDSATKAFFLRAWRGGKRLFGLR